MIIYGARITTMPSKKSLPSRAPDKIGVITRRTRNGDIEEIKFNPHTYMIDTSISAELSAVFREYKWTEAKRGRRDVLGVGVIFVDYSPIPYKRYFGIKSVTRNFIRDKCNISDKGELYDMVSPTFREKYFPIQLHINAREYDLSTVEATMGTGDDKWFLKPTFGYTGEGIIIVSNPNQVKPHIDLYTAGIRNKMNAIMENKNRISKEDAVVYGVGRGFKSNMWLLSKNIDPLLMGGKKFHIRVYYIVTRTDMIRGFISKISYIYVAKHDYDINNTARKVHNLHYANSNIEIFPDYYTEHFGQERTNKLMADCTEAFKYIFEKHTTMDLYENETSNCYYIYGADITTDSRHNLKIFEINLNPLLDPLKEHKKVIDSFTHNMFEVIFNPIFGAPEGFVNRNEYIALGSKPIPPRASDPVPPVTKKTYPRRRRN